jgi:hypothetical protein
LRQQDDQPFARKLERLSRIAQDLRRGEHFAITRLTPLKAFCADPRAAVRFGLYLTELAMPKAKKRYRPLVDRTVFAIRRHVKKPRSRLSQSVYALLQELGDSQKEVEHHRWVDVRIIRSREALCAEYALCCLLRPWESSHWGYRLAAFHAERYDPHYGTGLIPHSASALEEIIAFWERHLTTTGRSTCARRG